MAAQNIMAQIRSYVSLAESNAAKAAREYAKYKNCDADIKWGYYRTSQEYYGKAKLFVEKARNMMSENGVDDISLLARLDAIESEIAINR